MVLNVKGYWTATTTKKWHFIERKCITCGLLFIDLNKLVAWDKSNLIAVGTLWGKVKTELS